MSLIIAHRTHATTGVCHETNKRERCAGSFFICFLFVAYIAVFAVGFTGLLFGLLDARLRAKSEQSGKSITCFLP